jgi:hypothetical protein
VNGNEFGLMEFTICLCNLQTNGKHQLDERDRDNIQWGIDVFRNHD